jgi:hypothetical protein
LGFSVEELARLNDEELVNYRLELFKLVREKFTYESKTATVSGIGSSSSIHRFTTFYTQNVEIDLKNISSQEVTLKSAQQRPSLSSKLVGEAKLLEIVIYEKDQDTVRNLFLHVSLEDKPVQILRQYFRLKLKNIQISEASLDSILNDYIDMFVLNVAGCNDILFGDEYPIKRYKVSAAIN